MVTCTKCGTQFEGRFCPSCGAAAADPAFIPPPPPQPVVAGIPSNVASVLAYLIMIIGPLLCLMVAPTNRDRKVRFDAFQALFIQIAFIVCNILIGFFSDVSWHLGSLLRRILDLAYLIVIVYMIFKSAQNQKVVLPYVGPLAEKQV